MSNNAKKINKNIKKTIAVVPKKSYNVLVSAIICFLFAFILYSNTFTHSYVLDDKGIITDNWVVKGGIQNIPLILKTTYWYGTKIVLNTYRPLSKIMFAIEWQISPNNPHLSHFINVLFYALSCLLLFIALQKYMSKINVFIPLVITLLYAAHPIHTEVVANIKSRDEIMSFFFLLLTLLFLHTWFIKTKWWSLIVSLIMYFLSFMSKEGVVTMIFLFPVIGWYFTDAKPKTILIGSFLLILPAIVYVVIRHQILSKYTEPFTVSIVENFLIAAPDALTHFATAVMLLGKYLLLSIIPYQLVSNYSYNQIPIVGLGNPMFILSFIIYIAIFVYIILNFRKKSFIVFGLLFFLITISMYSNILFQIVASFGERLMFLSSLGLCIAFVFFIAELLKVGITNKIQSEMELLKTKPIFTILFIVILLAFSIKTVVRASEWKNESILFSNDIKRSPNSAQMCLWSGITLLEKANKEEDTLRKDDIMLQGVAQFEKGLSIYPSFSLCYEQLSLAWFELGDINKAMFYANKALKLNPKEAVTWRNIGLFYYKSGDFQNALEYYKKAVSIDAGFSDDYLNIGCILGILQRYEESIVEFKKCIQLAPDNITAHQYIGLCYQNLNQQEEANQWFEKAHILEQKKKK